MKTANTNTKQKQVLWLIGLIILVVAAYFLFSSGSERKAELSIAPTGGSPSVYIDRTQRDALSSSSNPTNYQTSPGNHQVIISRDGYWPWSDDVTAEAEATTEVTPFLIEETPRSVLQTASSVQSNLDENASTALAGSSTPIISSDEQMRAYVSGDSNLIAQWNQATSSAPDYLNCRGETCGVSVYNQTPITQIAFYPDRHDVLFFATETGVYAIEIDPSGETQNFQPVAQSISNPVFSLDEDRIFVQSDSGVTVSNI